MSLKLHSSRLIPNAGMSDDGRILVTDTSGTWAIRNKSNSERRGPISSSHLNVKTFRSYDETKKANSYGRRYKQRNNRFGTEVAALSATVSSGGSGSLQRRLRHRMNNTIRTTSTGGKFANGTGSFERRKHGGVPRMSQADADYLANHGNNLPGSTRSLDRKGRSRGNLDSQKRIRSMGRDFTRMTNGRVIPNIYKDTKQNPKKLADEPLPGVYFVIAGILLTLIGVTQLLFSLWSSYYGAIWTGVLIFLLGAAGISHKADYLTKWKNGLYIFLCVLSSIAILICLYVFFETTIPLLENLSPPNSRNASQLVAASVGDFDGFDKLGFGRKNRPIVATLSNETMVWMTVGLNLSGSVLCLACFFVVTAMLVAISNHWDAVYRTTSDCDHRGSPRFFSPLEQVTIGYSCVVIGYLAWRFTTSKRTDYRSYLWTGVLMYLSGLVTTAFGKRRDKTSWGVVAMLMQFLTIAACSFSIVFSTLNLVDDIRLAQTNGNTKNMAIAAAVFGVIYTVSMIISVIFIVGILFRLFRHVCHKLLDEN